MCKIELNVEGSPPAKSETLSCLGEGHGHAPRVRLLLEAARDWLANNPGYELSVANLALELTVYVPSERHVTCDATNYLGGVADVLQAKRNATERDRKLIGHLGELGMVALYANDRQIKEVHYYQRQGDLRYTVRLIPL